MQHFKCRNEKLMAHFTRIWESISLYELLKPKTNPIFICKNQNPTQSDAPNVKFVGGVGMFEVTSGAPLREKTNTQKERRRSFQKTFISL